MFRESRNKCSKQLDDTVKSIKMRVEDWGGSEFEISHENFVPCPENGMAREMKRYGIWIACNHRQTAQSMNTSEKESTHISG
jgi:hypothetical protein